MGWDGMGWDGIGSDGIVYVDWHLTNVCVPPASAQCLAENKRAGCVCRLTQKKNGRRSGCLRRMTLSANTGFSCVGLSTLGSWKHHNAPRRHESIGMRWSGTLLSSCGVNMAPDRSRCKLLSSLPSFLFFLPSLFLLPSSTSVFSFIFPSLLFFLSLRTNWYNDCRRCDQDLMCG